MLRAAFGAQPAGAGGAGLDGCGGAGPPLWVIDSLPPPGEDLTTDICPPTAPAT